TTLKEVEPIKGIKCSRAFQLRESINVLRNPPATHLALDASQRKSVLGISERLFECRQIFSIGCAARQLYVLLLELCDLVIDPKAVRPLAEIESLYRSLPHLRVLNGFVFDFAHVGNPPLPTCARVLCKPFDGDA